MKHDRVPLQVYIDARHRDLADSVDRRFHASDAARDAGFEAIGAASGRIADEQETYREGTRQRLMAMERKIDLNTGRSSGINQFWGVLVGVVGVAIAVVTLIVR